MTMPSETAIDLVLFATGYDYKLPFLDEQIFEWKDSNIAVSRSASAQGHFGGI
jgi:hypothetical protein